MHKITALLALLCLTASLTAQQPQLKVADKDSGKVVMTKLLVDVKIVANIAITTMEMEFCNSSKRVLEGELTFPLPEGVSINRYAIDINGKMREAVPVEKEKGQVVFENTIKKKVDPGLLEKVEGNSFRTRIYPLTANGCRKVIIAYQEALFAPNSNALSYHLPLESKKIIPNFSFTINVLSKNEPEIGKACNTNLTMVKRNNVYTATTTEKNFKPNGSFTINLPKLTADEDVVMQQKNGQYYFLVNDFPQYKAVPKKVINNAQLVWDNSFSGLTRNHKAEIDFVKAYMAAMQNGTITLSTIGYNFTTIGTFTISNGTNADLLKALTIMVYDGATNLSLIQWSAAVQEHLLISDGINTYGNLSNVNTPTATLYCLSAANSTNFSNLRSITDKTGGQCINLQTISANKAIALLQQQPLRLIAVNGGSSTSEIYPGYGIVQGNMVITGISSTPTTTLLLQYGYGNTVSFTDTVMLDAIAYSTNDIDIAKIWAQQKINQLEVQYDVFKTTIQELGAAYNLVTKNTSLIVLDDVADYVKYSIPPPAELLAEYNALVKQNNIALQQKTTALLGDAKNMMLELMNWYKRDYTPKLNISIVDSYTKKSIQDAAIMINNVHYKTTINGQLSINNIDSATVVVQHKDYKPRTVKIDGYQGGLTEIALESVKSQRVHINDSKARRIKPAKEDVIEGILVDKTTGTPVAFATVKVVGTTRGFTTTSEGHFSIKANKPTTLNLSSVGYQPLDVKLTNGGYYNVYMWQSNKQEENVVVTGNYATRRMTDSTRFANPSYDGYDQDVAQKREVTGSVQTISAENITRSPDRSSGEILQGRTAGNLEQALAGKVPGVQINAAAGASYNVTLSDIGSLSSSSKLYIVDGVETDEATFKNRSTNGWASISSINDASGVSLYGSRAANGVVVATTKEYQAPTKEKAKIELKQLGSDKPFIKTLEAIAANERYQKYIQLREEYLYTPSFYVEVANFFFAKNEKAIGLQILSTVADLNLNDHELYKMLGYQLKKQGEYAEALNVFKKVLDWRKQEPQSYRDYALALQDAGLYQNAFDTLYTTLTNPYDSDLMNAFKGIEETLLMDMNNIAALHPTIKMTPQQKTLVNTIPVDVRVVLNWNMNDSDMDLWVIDPRGEKCYYSNKQTKIGGRISDDFTDGYGPEQFILKKALKGKYKVMLHYYGDSQQKIAGGTTLLAEIYTNYSRTNQERQLVTLQLQNGEKEGILVGEFSFK